MSEAERIVLALAAADVIHSDADGFDFCGVCGSSDSYAGLLRHADDCPYLAALAYRAAQDEQRERWEQQETQDFAAHFASKEVAPADWELDEMAESEPGGGTGGRRG